MAEFNPFLPEPNIPDWTNAPGRLIDGSGLGEIFSKTALNVAGLVVDAKDKNDKSNIYDSAEQAAEDGRMEALSTAAGVSPSLAKSMEKTKLWQMAFESGRYTEGQFFTKMDTWAKEMKNRYPNQKETIDQQTQRVMGRTPANLMLDTVRSQYKAEQDARSTAADADEKFFAQNADGLNPDEQALFWNSADGSEMRKRLRVKAYITKGENEKQKAAFTTWEQDNKKGAAGAAAVAASGMDNIEREMYLGATSIGGGNVNSLRETINKLAEDGFTPEELTQIKQITDKTKQSVLASWTELMSKPGSDGKSLSDVLATNSDLYNAQKKRFDDVIKSLDELTTGKTGAFSLKATMAEAALDPRTAKLESILGKDAVDGIEMMRKFLPPDLFSEYLTNATQDNDPFQAIFGDLIKGISYKEGSVYSAIDKVKAQTDPSLIPTLNKEARAELQSLADLAANPKVPIEERNKAFDSIISDPENNFLRSLKDKPDNTGFSSREKFYQWLKSPEQAATAKALGKEKEYTAKLKSAGVALATGNVDQANESNTSTKYMDITFNPKTMLAEATLNKSLAKNPEAIAKYIRDVRQGKLAQSSLPGVSDVPFEDLDQIKRGMDSVQKLNMIFQGLTIAIRNEKPGISDEDLGKELQQYMGDLRASYDKKDPWQTKVWESIKNADWLGDKAQEKWKKDQKGEDFGVVPDNSVDFSAAEGGATSSVGTTPNTGDDTANSILGMIHGAEGADYNTVFGGGKVDAAGMTVADVIARTDNAGSSAFGAVQVMKKTLKGLVKNGVVTPEDAMTPETQDKIGLALMKEAGYDDWKSGKMSDGRFADKLAAIWASLPDKSGKSVYESDGVNKARMSRGDVLAFLDQLR